MEILMKCTPTTKPTPSTNVPQSATATSKIMDHHRQLQQHNLNGQTSVQPSAVTPESSLCCLDCPPPLHSQNIGPQISCCSMSVPHSKNLVWDHTASHHQLLDYCSSGYEQHGNDAPPLTSFIRSMRTPPCFSSMGRATPPTTPQHHLNLTFSSDDYVQTYEYREPEENFVSIDDAKIKGFLMQMSRRHCEQDESQKKKKFEPKKRITYEIIDLDDEEERQKLKRIKEQAERDLAAKSSTANLRKSARNETSSIRSGSCNTASISLIPKRTCATGKERIIAQIDLVDSSSSSSCDDDEAGGGEACLRSTQAKCNHYEEKVNDENDDDDDDDDEEQMSLAAVAVTCELQCEDDDGQSIHLQQQNEVDNEPDDLAEQAPQSTPQKGTTPKSDDEEFIDEHEEGLELRWDDFEQKERSFFECFLCGKKVQSSYNLRRHMMIHTGERPFACDLCERRFREFSDLKKHRRRHANDPNFLCMVCRLQPPTAGDATRCSNCDTKQSAIVASSRPQLNTSPAEIQKTSMHPRLTLSTTTTKTKVTVSATKTATYQQIAYKPDKSTAMSVFRKVSRPLSRTSLNRTPPPHTPAHTVTELSPSPPPPPPPLTPIAASNLLLDSLPAVHRPSYNQMGVVTRKEFPCPLCQRAFGTRHNLKRHFMIHTGEKPFSCPKCRKPFREYSTLKKHMVTHDRDRWYKCSRCPKKFRDYLDYNDHRLSHPEGECSDAMSPVADSSSSNTPTLRPKRTRKTTVRYLEGGYEDSNDTTEDYEDDDAADRVIDEISMDMAWLECCECGLRFTDLDEYTEHLKEHAATIRPYECYICKKSFGQHYELVRHMDEHNVNRESKQSTTVKGKQQRDSKKSDDLKMGVRDELDGRREKEKERESKRTKRRKSGFDSKRSRR